MEADLNPVRPAFRVVFQYLPAVKDLGADREMVLLQWTPDQVARGVVALAEGVEKIKPTSPRGTIPLPTAIC